jgi:hypothetical protein
VRNFIFTDAERRLLYRWLGGELERGSDNHLHTTLNRLSRAWRDLSWDMRLMLLAMRVLRMKGDKRRFHFVVGPIPLSYDVLGVRVYLNVERLLREANDPYASSRARLEATAKAAQEALRLGGG